MTGKLTSINNRPRGCRRYCLAARRYRVPQPLAFINGHPAVWVPVINGDVAMKRFLLAGLASAALALSPLSTRQAQAGEGAELLGLLLGIGTVYAIGKGIEQARATEAVVEPVADRGERRHRLAPGYGWRTPQRILPRNCLSTFETWHGEMRGFSADCLAHELRRPDRLPAMCAVDTRIGHREARIYAARCLQLEGWEIGGADARWRPAPEWRGGHRLAQ
jgi:hypothetical protein